MAIEKQLISLGFDDTLRISKRPLEKGILRQNDDYDEILNADILDIFVDWDFEKDNSIITLILKPKINEAVMNWTHCAKHKPRKKSSYLFFSAYFVVSKE